MERTWKPTAAGVLSIISGVLEIMGGIWVIVLGGLIGGLAGWSEMWEPWIGEMAPMFPDIMGMMGMISTWAIIGGVILLVFGVIALVGGVHSIKRKRWGLALAGAILSFPFVPFGGVLGLLAIIFVSLGKGEFE
jgi:hypothetical protein